MNSSHLALTVSVAKAATLDTLEALLAIARRGGLQLASLQLRSRERDDAIFLEVSAAQADLLELFLARVRNLAEIGDLAVLEGCRIKAQLI